MESTTAGRRAVDAATLAEAFRITAANRPDAVAVRTKGGEASWTWEQLRERVDALAGGLAGLGLDRGRTMAIMLGNRPEFHLVDLAAMTLGATPFFAASPTGIGTLRSAKVKPMRIRRVEAS